MLIASHAYPPRRTAGVEIYAQSLARAVARTHPVRLLYPVPDRDRPDRSIRTVHLDDGLIAYELTQHGRYERFEETYLGHEVAAVIGEAVAGFGPGVVHAQHLEGLGLEWMQARARAGARVLLTVHDHLLTCANGGQRYHPTLGACPVGDVARCARCTAHLNPVGLRVRRWARAMRSARAPAGVRAARTTGGLIEPGRSLLGRLDRGGERRIERRWRTLLGAAEWLEGFLVPSRTLARELVDFGLPAAKVRHVPAGIDLGPFVRRAPPQRARRFGYVGSIVPHKGVHVLIDALRAARCDAELVVAGSLDADPAYAARLGQGGLPPNVRLLGEVPHDELPKLLAGLDCLVVPSLWEENAPLVVMEAFAAGVPVVASRIGGLTEQLEAGGGATFPAGSVHALRALLEQAGEADGPVRGWAESIPPVRGLDAHVADVLEIYRSGIG